MNKVFIEKVIEDIERLRLGGLVMVFGQVAPMPEELEKSLRSSMKELDTLLVLLKGALDENPH